MRKIKGKDAFKRGIGKYVRRICCSIFFLCLAGGLASLLINSYVKSSVRSNILSPQAVAHLEDVDCVLVLGCYVQADGNPSHMLADRLDQGIALYQDGVAPKLLMSGDHGSLEYDEVNVMKAYATERKVKSEDVFMDHAGFSTYESLYRAREIFGIDKVVIVTQKYHLYRALYIARQLGIEAYGVEADLHSYSGQDVREFREYLARNKDFFGCILHVKPKYLGEEIPIYGNGDITND